MKILFCYSGTLQGSLDYITVKESDLLLRNIYPVQRILYHGVFGCLKEELRPVSRKKKKKKNKTLRSLLSVIFTLIMFS